jgi:hypothetical protein
MKRQAGAAAELEAVLDEAIGALSRLDAEAAEALAERLEAAAERPEPPPPGAELSRLRSRHWILGHLLAGTWGRLEMLRRLSSPPEDLGGYGGRAARPFPERGGRSAGSRAAAVRFD